jgi:hypothetical protein
VEYALEQAVWPGELDTAVAGWFTRFLADTARTQACRQLDTCAQTRQVSHFGLAGGQAAIGEPAPAGRPTEEVVRRRSRQAAPRPKTVQ